MRYLSLFSGIEAASVAWGPLGWTPAAFAEIDPFCRELLARRFPGVPNLGDVRGIKGDEFGPVDVVVFGSPCTDWSVVGKRKGAIDDATGERTRSGLYFEAMRVVRACKPRFFVMENVPGLLTSKRGRDFALVLGEASGLAVDPPKGGWQAAGVVRTAVTGRHSVCWRIVDAQYFGLAQRRKRVFLVGHLGDWAAAAQVLLELEGLRGDPPPRRASWEEAAGPLGAGSPGRGWSDDLERAGAFVPEVANGLRADSHDASEDGAGRGTLVAPAIAFQERGRSGGRTVEVGGDKAYALTSPRGGGQRQTMNVCAPLRASLGKRGADDSDRQTFVPELAYALARPTGGARLDQNGETLVAFNVRADGSTAKEKAAIEAERSRCLDSNGGFAAGQGGTVVVSGGSNPCVDDGLAQPITTRHLQQGVICFDEQQVTHPENRSLCLPGQPAPTLNQNAARMRVAFCANEQRTYTHEGENNFRTRNVVGEAARVRRLTPAECEILQGFPVGWTLIPYGHHRDKDFDEMVAYWRQIWPDLTEEEARELAADGPRYRALGNSFPVPVVRWIGRRLEAVDRALRGEKEEDRDGVRDAGEAPGGLAQGGRAEGQAESGERGSVQPAGEARAGRSEGAGDGARGGGVPARASEDELGGGGAHCDRPSGEQEEEWFPLPPRRPHSGGPLPVVEVCEACGCLVSVDDRCVCGRIVRPAW